MVNSNHRSLSKFENWVIQYEDFVDSLEEGYSMGIYEYTNDISCRNSIEEDKENEDIQLMWQRVEKADSKLKKLLIPINICIYGEYSEERFWLWGYPPNSPELLMDLKERFNI